MLLLAAVLTATLSLTSDPPTCGEADSGPRPTPAWVAEIADARERGDVAAELEASRELADMGSWADAAAWIPDAARLGVGVTTRELAERALFDSIRSRDVAVAADLARRLSLVAAGRYDRALADLAVGLDATADPAEATVALERSFESAMHEGWLDLAVHAGTVLATRRLASEDREGAVHAIDLVAASFRSPVQRQLFERWDRLMNTWLGDAPSEVFEPFDHAFQVFEVRLGDRSPDLPEVPAVEGRAVLDVVREESELRWTWGDGESTSTPIGVGERRDVVFGGWWVRIRGTGFQVVPAAPSLGDDWFRRRVVTRHRLAGGETLRVEVDGRVTVAGRPGR